FMPRHQSLAHAYLGGQQNLQDAIAGEQVRIDETFDSLIAVDERIGGLLKLRQSYSPQTRNDLTATAIHSQWQALKAELATLKPAASDAHHGKIIDSVRNLL